MNVGRHPMGASITRYTLRTIGPESSHRRLLSDSQSQLSVCLHLPQVAFACNILSGSHFMKPSYSQ